VFPLVRFPDAEKSELLFSNLTQIGCGNVEDQFGTQDGSFATSFSKMTSAGVF
jgi:hypothetical protein